jgi:uncharacterized protein (DUF433 family)
MVPYWKSLIEQNPEVMMGKPCIAGTRLTVEHLLDKLGSGVTYEELMKSYPVLKREHILAAQAYAADYLSFDRTIWSPEKTA